MTSLMRFEQMLVTPDQARRWLADQEFNRALRQIKVKEYASDMKSGRWMATAQPIMINQSGKLIDGQHRLHAVIESGAEIEMLVAFDVPDEHRRYIDGGVPRATRDVLKMEDGLSSAWDLQALARTVLLYERVPEKVWVGAGTAGIASKQLIIDEVRQNVDAYNRAIQIARQIDGLPRTGHLRRSTYGSLVLLIDRYSNFAELLDEWHTGLSTGANLPMGDPRLALRSATSATNFGGTQSGLMACLRAWNAFVTGEELRQLKVSQRYLPMPKVK